MNNSEALLKTRVIPKWLPIAILIVSFFGFADASYLSIEHITGGTPNCSVLEGCDVVTTSKYSEVFGIPVALGGAFFYLTMFILTILHLDTKKETFLRFAAMITPAGLLASIYFVFVMAVLLEAWCLYCLGSAASSTTLFVLGMIVLQKTSR